MDSIPLTVLVVDDEPLLRWSIAELLRRAGHSVLEAASAAEARAVMARITEVVHVVLLDYRLPDADGLGLFEQVRQRLPRAAVVLMTAFGSPEMRETATALGAYCVIDKPFDMYDLELLVWEAARATSPE